MTLNCTYNEQNQFVLQPIKAILVQQNASIPQLESRFYPFPIKNSAREQENSHSVGNFNNHYKLVSDQITGV